LDTKGGFVLKGRNYALFPVKTDSDSGTIAEALAIQWHVFRSDRSRLYMAEAKDKAPSIRPVGTEVLPTEFMEALKEPKRHFLGLYLSANVCTGTPDSHVDLIATARGRSCVREKSSRWPISWSRTVNLSVGGGLAGASFGLSTGFRIPPPKERRLLLDLSRNIRQHLDATRSNFALLYNVQSTTAWLCRYHSGDTML
jgi:hypothetical protein